MNEVTVFVGPGMMAEAMATGLVRKAGVAPGQILMSGPNPARLQELADRYGLATTTDNRSAVQAASTIVLSVKPQTLPKAAADLKGRIPKDSLVISIAAGVPLWKLDELLDHSRLVRAMPNTPAQVGEAITVWTATPEVNEGQRATARQLLSAIGQEIYVEDEDYLDMATALSGTGPAYVYLFMESLVDAGVHLGFPRRIAEQLVVQTVKGSVAYYEAMPKHFAGMRNQVTSPGGTTAAALYYLEKAGFRTALSRAIWAAYERSTQLGEGKKSGSVAEG
ncbi:MAG: pyrroline-5-carboxylate reductase [Anaerolineales bacterium]|nr:pyrroline-5-carboxylate reductase [Anaerolineales bacterium]